MNRQKAYKRLGLDGNMRMKLKSGTTLSFARCGMKDIKRIEAMKDRELIDTEIDYGYMAHICVSISDLQFADLKWLEISSRGLVEKAKKRYEIRELKRKRCLFNKIATGRAKCNLCGKVVKENTNDIFFRFGSGPSSVERHYHQKCVKKLCR